MVGTSSTEAIEPKDLQRSWADSTKLPQHKVA